MLTCWPLVRLYLALPHMEHLCVALDPRRFLDSLALSAGTRPHAALLYILFAEASRILIKQTPMPFGSNNVLDPHSEPDISLLQYAKDLQEPFFERAQKCLRDGLELLDRPLDLLKASTLICRYLVARGRSIEAWHSPCLRLVVACGLHRITSPVIRPPTSIREPSINSGSNLGWRDSNTLSADYGRMYDRSPKGRQSDLLESSWQAFGDTSLSVPPQRPTERPLSQASNLVIIPPPGDDLEVWERIELFWAVKELDWGMSTHFGWTAGIHDGEIQTPWPQSRIEYEKGTVEERLLGGICELIQPRSRTILPQIQSPRVLALMSLCLAYRASR